MGHERETLEAVTNARAAATAGPERRARAARQARRRAVAARWASSSPSPRPIPTSRPTPPSSNSSSALQTVEDEIQLSRRYYNGAVAQPEHRGRILPVQPRRQHLQVREGRVLRARKRRRPRRPHVSSSDLALSLTSASCPRASPSAARHGGGSMGRQPLARDRWPAPRGNDAELCDAVGGPMSVPSLPWRLCSSPPPRSPREDITLLHHQRHPAADGTVDVTETIEVNAEGDRDPPRHLSATSRPPDQRRQLAPALDLNVSQVTRDGRAEPYTRRRHRQRLQAHPHRRRRRLPRQRRPPLHHPLHHDPHGPVLRRPRRALLERHRQLLGLPDPAAPSPPSRCRTAP